MKYSLRLALELVGIVIFGVFSIYVTRLPYLVTPAYANALQSVLSSICAAFVFAFLIDSGIALRDRFDRRTFRVFFGDLAVVTKSFLVYPDFVFSDACLKLLQTTPPTDIFRRRSDQFPGARFIDVPHIVASNDLTAIVIVATGIGRYLRDSPVLITDGQAVADSNKSLISFGLTSNAVTDLYLNSDSAPLFKIDDVSGQPTIVVEVGGKTERYGRTSDHQHGIILRYRPTPEHYPLEDIGSFVQD